MHTATLNLTILGSIDSADEVSRVYRLGGPFALLMRLPFHWVSRRHCRYMIRHGTIIAEQSFKRFDIARSIRAATEKGESTEFIDESGGLDAHLTALIDSVNRAIEQVRRVRAMHDDIGRELSTFNRDLLETEKTFSSALDEARESALILQEAIKDHDSKLRMQHDGYIAESSEDVLRLLAQIAAA